MVGVLGDFLDVFNVEAATLALIVQSRGNQLHLFHDLQLYFFLLYPLGLKLYLIQRIPPRRYLYLLYLIILYILCALIQQLIVLAVVNLVLQVTQNISLVEHVLFLPATTGPTTGPHSPAVGLLLLLALL
jgi:hypothetical protein